MKTVIFDIDGTVANIQHRVHHLPNWSKFFSEMSDDAPIEPIIWLNRMLDRDGPHRVIVVSARPDNYKDETVQWLHKHGVFYDKLYMRRDGDFRSDVIVKQELLEQILKDGYEPWLVIDDRPEVVDMWRSFGICTLQCASDEIKLKHDGKHFLDIMVGPSGAGKSTYVAETYSLRDVIETDQIREEYGWDHSPEDLQKTWSYAHALLRARLENHLFTVFDATNLKQADRLKLLRQVPRGQYVRYVVIDRRLEDKERARGWRPLELILKHHRLMQKEIGNIMSGDGLPNVVVVDGRHK